VEVRDPALTLRCRALQTWGTGLGLLQTCVPASPGEPAARSTGTLPLVSCRVCILGFPRDRDVCPDAGDESSKEDLGPVDILALCSNEW